MCGYVVLLDGVILSAILGGDVVATLVGVALATIDGPAWSALGGAATSFFCWGLL